MTPQPSPRETTRHSEVNIELYECGCKVRIYQMDPGEWEGDSEKQITVTELMPCVQHNHNGNSTPPKDARLVSVFGERESYLNE